LTVSLRWRYPQPVSDAEGGAHTMTVFFATFLDVA
jgi:hypothetical protein